MSRSSVIRNLCRALLGVALIGASHTALAQRTPTPKAPAPKTVSVKSAEKPADIDPLADRDDTKDPPGLKRLSPDGKVWLDAKNKRVVTVGEVCLREGQLEMFACLKGTKEHESILAVPTKAYVVHAALVALGAEPGAAAQFAPKYMAAHGPRVDVTLFWTDDKGKRQHANAQDWIRNVKTGKAMTDYWVFGGSGFWKDETSGQQFYKAEDGDFICISNFNSAMLDLPVESSQSNEALLFEAMTDNIPPTGTKVTLVLTPRLEEEPKAGGPSSRKTAPTK